MRNRSPRTAENYKATRVCWRSRYGVPSEGSYIEPSEQRMEQAYRAIHTSAFCSCSGAEAWPFLWLLDSCAAHFNRGKKHSPEKTPQTGLHYSPLAWLTAGRGFAGQGHPVVNRKVSYPPRDPAASFFSRHDGAEGKQAFSASRASGGLTEVPSKRTVFVTSVPEFKQAVHIS